MDSLRYCVEARSMLDEIKSKPIGINKKIMLLECLKLKLQEASQMQQSNELEKSKLDLNSTFFTETKSILGQEEEEVLIFNILKKQKERFELEQEIEICEDDLNEISKTVETKQAYNDELGVQIVMKNR